jgi:hypothetical protein
MLDDLASVDWAAVEHVYGEASDVPEHLRAVVSVALEPRERAALDQRIVEGLVKRMGAYGEAGRAALAAVAPQAKSSALLQSVLNAWGRGLA